MNCRGVCAMKHNWIKPFTIEAYTFNGAYSFSNGSGYNYILSKAGNSIVLDDKLLLNLNDHIISEDFALKLLTHGLIEIKGVEHCNTKPSCTLDIVKPSVFVIDITKACNMNCIYCFRDLNNHKTIKLQTLKDICNYIDTNVTNLNIQKISIQLWGGEPLCAINQIRFVSDYFSDKTYSVKLDIETNATLITPQIAKELYDKQISVGVSLDGYPEIQNRQRPLENGNESSDAVKIGINNLASVYGNNFGGICVITKYNYRHIVELLNYYVNVLGLHSLKFNLVRDNPNASSQSIGLTEKEARKFCETLIEALKFYKILGVDFSEGNILTKYYNLIEHYTGNCCISQGCTGGIRILSFDMNGDIYPCEMTDYPEVKLGSIYSDEDLMSIIKKASCKNSYYKTRKKGECNTCPWWCFCKGGCSSRVYYIHQPDSVDEIECILNQTIYPQLIDNILNRKIGTVIT